MAESVRRRAFWVSLAASLGVAVVASLGDAVPAGAQIGIKLSRACVYADAPHPPLFTGHAFLQLIPNSGPQARPATRRTLVYGFVTKPGQEWRATIGGPGAVISNADHVWTYRICYNVNRTRYNAMQAEITRDEKAPPNYKLTTFNCTNWVLRIAKTGGLTVPPASPPRAGLFLFGPFIFDPRAIANVADPDTLAVSLATIGVGKMFHGGTVEDNPKNLRPNAFPDSASTQLDVDSYTGLLEFALADPGRLAAGTGLHDDERRLALHTLGTNGSLTLKLADVRAANAIIGVSWGDGSAIVQRATTAHRYSRPGTYLVRAVVVRGAVLFRVTFVERVVMGDGSDHLQFTVPVSDRPTVAFPSPPAPPIPLPI